MHPYMLEANRLEISLAEKSMRVLVGVKSNLSYQSDLVAKAANSVSSWIRKSIFQQGEGGESFPLSTAEIQLQQCGPSE